MFPQCIMSHKHHEQYQHHDDMMLEISEWQNLLRDALKLWHSDDLQLSDEALVGLFDILRLGWLNIYTFSLVLYRLASTEP